MLDCAAALTDSEIRGFSFMSRFQRKAAVTTQRQLCAEFVAKFLFTGVRDSVFILPTGQGTDPGLSDADQTFCFNLRPGYKTFSADRLTMLCASGQSLQICNEFITNDLSKT